MNTAYMLRQDGKDFPVKVHLYAMGDEDLSSEAECASFIIKTNSKDINLCEYILDAWMAMLIEDNVSYDSNSDDINNLILTRLSTLPYKFPYSLSNSEYLKIHKNQSNFDDVDTLYEFLDEVRSKLDVLQDSIRKSINQQFCRVRYGGAYNTERGNNTIWFRISSVGFNWVDVIYIFTSKIKNKLNIQFITICRDYESDNGDSGEPEYFYKAKDGAVYYNMPIDEYLEEEHEHSPVFSSLSLNSGVIASVSRRLSMGDTIEYINRDLVGSGIHIDDRILSALYTKELKSYVHASEFLDNASARTQSKFGRIFRKIYQLFPEITNIDLDSEPRENLAGKLVGVTYTFLLSSDNPDINNLELRVGYTKPNPSADIIVRDFRREYLDYKSFKNI